MNRVFGFHQTLHQDNYSILSQQFQRMQAQNNMNRASPTFEIPVPSPVSNNNGEPRPLPNLAAPGRFDVICARGSKAANHVGNLRFRDIIRQRLPEYNAAKTKLEKSLIVTSIVDSVRDYTPNGGFIKQDSDGQWYDVGDALAREKIGQCIRDQLHSKYKSSTRAKKQRRKELEKKKKDTGCITPPSEVESRFDPFELDDLRIVPNTERSMDTSVQKMTKDHDALALMLAPIGESFETGHIEAL